MDGPLECGASILQPERHAYVAICAAGGDERGLLFIFERHIDLAVASVWIQEG